MPSLKHFIEAMSASWPVALAIFIGSASALIGEALEIVYLTELPRWILSVLFLFSTFSAAILIVGFIRTFIEYINLARIKRKKDKWIAEHIKKLDDLPRDEVQVLGWAAENNKQVFLAPINHVRLEPLLAKGYVQLIAGSHSVLEWPHSVPDHIWDVVCERINSAPNEVPIPNPFGLRW